MIVPLILFIAQASLTTLDTNRDGSVSRVEATALSSLDAQFDLLDENRNGALEPAEFARFEELDRAEPPPLGSTPPRGTPLPPPDGSTPPPVPR